MKIDIELSATQENIDIDFGLNGFYTGSYEPESSVEGGELETANKKMLGNIKIKPIAVTKISNPSGGYSCQIG